MLLFFRVYSEIEVLIINTYGAQNETYIEDERPKRNEVV
jgi:hypothetical protein